MNVEDELTRLFEDDRLDVPVRPGAASLVVACARRRRQHRNAAAVTGGALTLVMLAAVGVALAGVDDGRTDTLSATKPPVTVIPTTTASMPGAPPIPQSESSDARAPSSSTATTSPEVPASAQSPSRAASRISTTSAVSQQRPASTDPTIGPDGWGRVMLGMSEAAAVATDEFDMSEGVSGSPCRRYWLRGGNAPVDISPTYGVARISAKSGVTTPEGIGVGSTDADVMSAYPDATTANYVITAPVPGNPDAVYIFRTDPSQRIFSLRLELATHNC